MTPPMKSRRCQEDGFDRGKPRSSGWWKTAGPVGKNGLLRVLFVTLVVAPHWSPTRETFPFSSACSDLKRADGAKLMEGVAELACEESSMRTADHNAGEAVEDAATSSAACVAVGVYLPGSA